jgi:predicted nucleotidyltransferase
MMNALIKEIEKRIKDHYGEKFQGLIIYGSMARGEANDSSDIDLLVLLAQPLNYFQELRKIVDILYPVQLEADMLISAKPAAVDEFQAGQIGLYRTAKREGLAL